MIVAAALALAACQGQQTERDLDQIGRDYQRQSQESANSQNTDDATRADVCGASRFAAFVGKPASSIDRSTLPPRARIISPGMMVTQDFVAGRLNIRVGPDDRVTAVQCF
jgi:hypothetical protein